MAYNNPVFEYFSNSHLRVTGTASADLVGKTFCRVATGGQDQNPNYATANAGGPSFGVVGWDAATGEKVTVFKKGVNSVTAGAALTAGAEVMANATGQAVPWTAATAPAVNRTLGIVLADAAAGEDAAVDLY